ncbi:hypothetical protein K490DRAFT_65359 [Saccharata proteae CBS 121410]|uniref:Peptidase S8/S53 domain-containing protein n=1 Tax=Saccharata proteae CBS 121410 TaxID=1314787 RepID=A0A9P4HYG3_9PEZI|nr:hypothetical protein K490DRAFT_65359 [Saccharata proteae CBS 121410]
MDLEEVKTFYCSAELAFDAADYARAALLFRDAALKADQAKALGWDHHQTLRIRDKWALSLQREGEYEAAIAQDNESLSRRLQSEAFGETHEETLENRRQLAISYSKVDKDKAVFQHREVLRQVKLTDCPTKIICARANDLAVELFQCGIEQNDTRKIHEAFYLSVHYLRKVESILSGSHRLVLDFRFNIGIQMKKLEKFEGVAEYFDKNIESLKSIPIGLRSQSQTNLLKDCEEESRLCKRLLASKEILKASGSGSVPETSHFTTVQAAQTRAPVSQHHRNRSDNIARIPAIRDMIASSSKTRDTKSAPSHASEAEILASMPHRSRTLSAVAEITNETESRREIIAKFLANSRSSNGLLKPPSHSSAKERSTADPPPPKQPNSESRGVDRKESKDTLKLAKQTKSISPEIVAVESGHTTGTRNKEASQSFSLRPAQTLDISHPDTDIERKMSEVKSNQKRWAREIFPNSMVKSGHSFKNNDLFASESRSPSSPQIPAFFNPDSDNDPRLSKDSTNQKIRAMNVFPDTSERGGYKLWTSSKQTSGCHSPRSDDDRKISNDENDVDQRQARSNFLDVLVKGGDDSRTNDAEASVPVNQPTRTPEVIHQTSDEDETPRKTSSKDTMMVHSTPIGSASSARRGEIFGTMLENEDHDTDKWFRSLNRVIDYFGALHDPDDSEYKPVKIALLDTGVAIRNYDLMGVTEGDKNMLKNSVFKGAILKNNLAYNQDTDGHGTNCAYLLAKICPFAKIYSYRVLEDQTQDLEPDIVAEALRDAVKKGVDIINMSFGWFHELTAEQRTSLKEPISEAYAKNILMFAAASNDGRSIKWPARCHEVIAIDSADAHGSAAKTNPSLSIGNPLRFMALGMGIKNIAHNPAGPRKKRISGSSFASPVAAASIALLLEFAKQAPLKTDSNVLKCLQTIEGIRTVLLNGLTSQKDINTNFHHIDITLFEYVNQESGDWWVGDSSRARGARRIVELLRGEFGFTSIGGAVEDAIYNERAKRDRQRSVEHR